jgi:hypothetical protein
MGHQSLCKSFVNVAKGAYKPLVCKQIVANVRIIGNTGKANKAEMFFLAKPNTIRERATLDLLYPTPSWLRVAVQKGSGSFVRITTGGFNRITTGGFLRVTAG